MCYRSNSVSNLLSLKMVFRYLGSSLVSMLEHRRHILNPPLPTSVQTAKLPKTFFMFLRVQTLTTKDCKGPENEYAEERRIYKDLISKNEK